MTRVTIIYRNVLLSLSLIAIAPGSAARGESPAKPAEKAAPARPAAVEKGERLIKALSTTNRPPRLPNDGDDSSFPDFPKDFDWKEYQRVRDAIKDLDANSEEVWPSIVDHMTDTDYCFTARFIDWAQNYSRGDVCVVIARNWISRGYFCLMPGGDGEQFRLPVKGAKALQEWCRARRNKSFVEIQIEAAEWAASTIRKEQRDLPEGLERTIAGIEGRIAKLRETNKPLREKFFVPGTTGWYTEAEAAQWRIRYGQASGKK